MNISSRFVSALVLALAFLQMATATTQVPGANASTLNDCTKVGLSSSHTEDCCQCACGNQECSIFKELGEELTCDAGKIHCYSEDVNEDEETASEAQAVGIEGEWVKTSQLQKCSDIPIPSATETEDCCQCACGHSECAVFKTKGNDLTCDISAVHCYEPDEEDDDEAKCSHIPIPSTTETEDCCQCACGHSECAVFKTAGNELACDISAVHCYEPDEEDDDEAKCTHIPIPSATETEDCCQCACGHSECAVFKTEDNELTCDISAVHCYHDDDESSDAAKDDGFSKLDKGVIANVVEITSNLDGHVASNQNGSTVVIIVVCSLVAAALVALALVAVGKRRNSSVAGSTSSDNKESYETDLESEFEEDV